MSSTDDAAALAADPRWLPLHFDPARGAVQFAWFPREDHRGVPFLTDQYLQEKAPPRAWLPLADIPQDSPATAHYIFHSAFCCSTLLATALDVPGASMGLKEPQLLAEMAVLARSAQLDPAIAGRLIGLLARPFGESEQLVIKPGNEVNSLAVSLLRSDPRSKALLLYAPLPRFLGSVARKSMWGRVWARRLLALLRAERIADFGFSDADYMEQTDLQQAALAWLLHQAQFAELARQFPDRVRAIDSESFLAAKTSSLAAMARHFEIDASKSCWAEVADGPTFAKHSKSIGQEFSETSGGSGGSIPPIIAEEIDLVVKWTVAVGQHVGIDARSPASGLPRLEAS